MTGIITCVKLEGFDFLHIQTADMELLSPEQNQLLSYLKTIHNMLMTFLAGSHVSDSCPLGYLFIISGGLFNYFSSTKSPSKYGSWGMLEYTGQDPATVGKYRAVQRYTTLTKLRVSPEKTQSGLGIQSVWSQFSLSRVESFGL